MTRGTWGGVVGILGVVITACGTYEWPDRKPAVTPQSFQVHEDALLSVRPADGGVPCPQPMAQLRLDSTCQDKCGPIKVARDGAVYATLLGAEVRRKSSVDPGRIERPYAKPPVDESRRAMPLPPGNYLVGGGCGLRGAAKSGPAPTQQGGSLGFQVGEGCAYTVDVSCQ